MSKKLTCRTCGAKYADYGDGFDGECPSCADNSFARDEERDKDKLIDTLREELIRLSVANADVGVLLVDAKLRIADLEACLKRVRTGAMQGIMVSTFPATAVDIDTTLGGGEKA